MNNSQSSRGPVPDEITQAARRIAQLRVKFVNQWVPGMDSPLTTREVDELFTATALQAEWIRELYEALHPQSGGSVERLHAGDWVQDEEGRRAFVLYTDADACCVTLAYTADLSTWLRPDGLTVLARFGRSQLGRSS